ncbi:uncharacterized protein LOC129794475 [Lutzomyia longipalpis]|uniref:uncharacterized protein LOC129794475 n=1 Tax=Lutzomyia longipalpis TaxID=7200 RepID=UPI002483683D|nr:uncharacterized protein LOC129794475 [Lutzomyia longipalpis]
MDINEKNIIFGGEQKTDLVKFFGSLGNYLLYELSRNKDKVAIIEGETGKEITYGEIKEKALNLAKFFSENGVKSGDVIGICSENCNEFIFTVYGAIFAGVTVAPINFSYTEDEFKHAFQLIKPKVVFATRFNIKKIINIVKECPSIEMIIQYGWPVGLKEISYFYEINRNQRKDLKSNEEFVNPSENLDRNAVIVLSSGTTGLPKGVQITERNFLGLFTQNIDGKALNGNDECVMSCLPWFHIYGLIGIISTATLRIVLVYLPRFEDHIFLSCIEKYNVKSTFLVPPLMVFLAKHPLVDKYNLSSLYEVHCGAAPLSKKVEDAVMARIPNVKIIRQGYGLSETTAGVLIMPKDRYKTGSVGTVVIGTYCKVVDPETGEILGPNQSGELCFKGPQIMRGYIGNDAATKDTMDKDGWLHTGDVGYYDEDKFFFIVDRLKELIKYKGFQVPPAELEALLVAHPKVLDAAVIGLPDDAAGELPLAFVVKKPNTDVTEKEIKDYIASKVTNYKQLRGGVRFIDEIPKNPSGKILRRELRDKLNQTRSKL